MREGAAAGWLSAEGGGGNVCVSPLSPTHHSLSDPLTHSLTHSLTHYGVRSLGTCKEMNIDCLLAFDEW